MKNRQDNGSGEKKRFEKRDAVCQTLSGGEAESCGYCGTRFVSPRINRAIFRRVNVEMDAERGIKGSWFYE